MWGRVLVALPDDAFVEFRGVQTHSHDWVTVVVDLVFLLFYNNGMTPLGGSAHGFDEVLSDALLEELLKGGSVGERYSSGRGDAERLCVVLHVDKILLAFRGGTSDVSKTLLNSLIKSASVTPTLGSHCVDSSIPPSFCDAGPGSNSRDTIEFTELDDLVAGLWSGGVCCVGDT